MSAASILQYRRTVTLERSTRRWSRAAIFSAIATLWELPAVANVVALADVCGVDKDAVFIVLLWTVLPAVAILSIYALIHATIRQATFRGQWLALFSSVVSALIAIGFLTPYQAPRQPNPPPAVVGPGAPATSLPTSLPPPQ